jgi:hypothetical protein
LSQTELILPEDGDKIQYPKRCSLNENRTMDNVQKHNKFILVLGLHKLPELLPPKGSKLYQPPSRSGQSQFHSPVASAEAILLNEQGAIMKLDLKK